MENENQEEKKEDVVLVGAGSISKRLDRGFLELSELTTHDFPLKKINGEWALSMNEFDAWLQKWGDGIAFHEITAESLRARKKYLNIMALPKKDRTLNGIKEIEKFMKIAPDVLLRLMIDFGFPMVKTGGIFCMSLDDLYGWMGKYGIKDPHEVSYSKIEPLYLKHRDNSLPDEKVSGDAKKICEILDIASGTFVDYLKYDPCPIRKIPGTDSAPRYEVSEKEWQAFCYMLAQNDAHDKKILDTDYLLDRR